MGKARIELTITIQQKLIKYDKIVELKDVDLELIKTETFLNSIRILGSMIAEANYQQDKCNEQNLHVIKTKEPVNNKRKRPQKDSDNDEDKRKKVKKDDENKKEIMINKIIEQLSVPMEKINIEERRAIINKNDGINGLIKLYNEAVDAEIGTIQKWYRYAKEFRRKIEEKSKQRKNRMSEQTIRKLIYNDMEAVQRNIKRKTLKTNTLRSENIYELFKPLGGEMKIQQVKNLTYTDLRDLTEEDRMEIIFKVKCIEELDR